MAGMSLATPISELKDLDSLRAYRRYLNNRMFWATSEAEVSKIHRKMNAVDKKIARLA